MGFNKFEKKLHRACESGELGTALWCLSVGADVDSVDGMGRTASHKAAFGDRVDCLAALLDAGANPKVSDLLGRTPLFVAANEGQRRCVELLTPCSDLGARDAMGNHAYLAAATSWKIAPGDSFDWILRLGEAMGSGLSEADRFASMRLAAGRGCVGMLATMVAPGDDPGPCRSGRRRSLVAAAESGSAECVALLINESDFDTRFLDPRDTWAQRAKERAWRWGHGEAARSIDEFGRVVAERNELALAIGVPCDPVAPERPNDQEGPRASRAARL